SGRGRRSSGGPVPVRGARGRTRGRPLLGHRHDGPAPGRPLAGDPADDRAGRGTPTGPARRGGGAGPTGRIARLRNMLTRAGGEQRHRDRVSGAPPPIRPRTGGGRGAGSATHALRRLPVATAAPRHGRRVRGATRPSALMRFRRHIPPVREWKLPAFDRLGARRWGLALLGALLGGYLTAYLLLFPAPLLHGHGVVPRVLGLSLQEASDQLRKAGLTVAQVESVQAAAPPGVAMLTRPAATSVLSPGAPVTVVVSRGAPTIAVADLLGLSQADARTRLELDGLTLGTVTRRRTSDA